MTSLRVALKLSMAEYKPDEKSGKRKSLLNSTKNKAEEPFQDDLTLLSGNKKTTSKQQF